MDDASVNTWGKGLNVFDGIERANVGDIDVGGSYLGGRRIRQ